MTIIYQSPGILATPFSLLFAYITYNIIPTAFGFGVPP